MASDAQLAHQRKNRKIPDEGEGSHAREIELKRSRGEISCAECRRLKIKCDKKLPCSSCLRRGCASLCPNGSLATGQGTRFVLAATDHLHKRIAKMSERIRQLEDALSVLQSRVTDDPHPLLRDELLTIKVDKTDPEATPTAEGDPSQEPSEVIDAFGTLSINDKGTSRFFGAAGGTEMLLLNEEDGGSSSTPYTSPSLTNVASPDSTRGSKSPRLPPEVARFSNAFPFTPMGPTREVLDIIESHLPPWERACLLSETYLEHAAWVFHAVSRQQLLDEMLPVIYKRQAPLDASHEYNGPHDIAVLFMIFAVGALVDLNQEPYNAEAEHYYNLAKAAITLQSILEKPELTTIQALHLMSIYNAMQQPDGSDTDGETSMEMSWSLIRLCHQLAQTIGLHRDSARWGLDPRDVQRRRALFWDLFVADSWQSLSTGRPPSITLPYIDCQFPLDDEAMLNEKGNTEPGYGAWGFRFACECVSQVAAKTLTAQVPSYSTILELDARVRDFPIPELPREFMESTRPSMIMTRYVIGHSREVILMCIHRSFFAQAMIDDPVNPLRSQYAPSFLACYRCAAHILKVIREQFDQLPELCSRFWATWTYAFSAAVVFGSIVTRGPCSSMSETALRELDLACELFSKAAIRSKRAAKALVVLQRLQAKAHAAFELAERNKDPTAPTDVPQLLDPLKSEDELAIFGGRTRLVAKRTGFTPLASPLGSAVTPTSSSQYRKAAHGTTSNSAPASTSGSVPSTPAQDAAEHVAARMNAVNEFANSMRLGQPWNSVANNPVQGVYRESIFSSEGAPASHHRPDMGLRSGLDTAHAGFSFQQHAPPLSGNNSGHSQSSGDSFGSGMHHAASSHQHMYDFPYGEMPGNLPHGVPGNPQGYDTYGPASQHNMNGAHLMQPNGAVAPSYAVPPRELAEMGLASQSSALNQRWTSFMHDSGVFYGGGRM